MASFSCAQAFKAVVPSGTRQQKRSRACVRVYATSRVNQSKSDIIVSAHLRGTC